MEKIKNVVHAVQSKENAIPAPGCTNSTLPKQIKTTQITVVQPSADNKICDKNLDRRSVGSTKFNCPSVAANSKQPNKISEHEVSVSSSKLQVPVHSVANRPLVTQVKTTVSSSLVVSVPKRPGKIWGENGEFLKNIAAFSDEIRFKTCTILKYNKQPVIKYSETPALRTQITAKDLNTDYTKIFEDAKDMAANHMKYEDIVYISSLRLLFATKIKDFKSVKCSGEVGNFICYNNFQFNGTLVSLTDESEIEEIRSKLSSIVYEFIDEIANWVGGSGREIALDFLDDWANRHAIAEEDLCDYDQDERPQMVGSWGNNSCEVKAFMCSCTNIRPENFGWHGAYGSEDETRCDLKVDGEKDFKLDIEKLGGLFSDDTFTNHNIINHNLSASKAYFALWATSIEMLSKIEFPGNHVAERYVDMFRFEDEQSVAQKVYGLDKNCTTCVSKKIDPNFGSKVPSLQAYSAYAPSIEYNEHIIGYSRVSHWRIFANFLLVRPADRMEKFAEDDYTKTTVFYSDYQRECVAYPIGLEYALIAKQHTLSKDHYDEKDNGIGKFETTVRLLTPQSKEQEAAQEILCKNLLQSEKCSDIKFMYLSGEQYEPVVVLTNEEACKRVCAICKESVKTAVEIARKISGYFSSTDVLQCAVSSMMKAISLVSSRMKQANNDTKLIDEKFKDLEGSVRTLTDILDKTVKAYDFSEYKKFLLRLHFSMFPLQKQSWVLDKANGFK